MIWLSENLDSSCRNSLREISTSDVTGFLGDYPWAAVIAWQESKMQVDKARQTRRRHNAVGTVLAGLKENKGVCRPGACRNCEVPLKQVSHFLLVRNLPFLSATDRWSQWAFHAQPHWRQCQSPCRLRFYRVLNLLWPQG